ncbi:MAG: CehA/McbA family metallohydrolase [Anaerolineae bacterium]|nr:CehA/McbA family metallohydrolase [Anaerolineae bacterium]
MEARTLLPGAKAFRGNLHTHTTVSDGELSPQDAVRWYRDHGYDFVAVTDHWRPLSPFTADGILIVPGVEFDGTDSDLGLYHIVGLDVPDCPAREELRDAAAVVSFIARAGGLAVLCHPYWCGMPSWAVARVDGVFAVEVYNATCEAHIAKGLSAVHWDDALAVGRSLWGLAVDDAHWSRADFGCGWVAVQADELSLPALRQALLAGRFYASTGPEILDFVVDGNRAYARTSEARRIAFICDAHRGGCVHAEAGTTVSEAEFGGLAEAKYVRLEVDDPQGRRAWSNPIYLAR